MKTQSRFSSAFVKLLLKTKTQSLFSNASSKMLLKIKTEIPFASASLRKLYCRGPESRALTHNVLLIGLQKL